MQFLMHTMIPPMRNNYTGLRFIAPQEENIETLRESGSPRSIDTSIAATSRGASSVSFSSRRWIYLDLFAIQ